MAVMCSTGNPIAGSEISYTNLRGLFMSEAVSRFAGGSPVLNYSILLYAFCVIRKRRARFLAWTLAMRRLEFLGS